MKKMFIENVPEDVHRRFKGLCAMKGISMKDSILQYMTSGADAEPVPSFEHIQDEESRYTSMIDSCWTGGDNVQTYTVYQTLVEQVEAEISAQGGESGRYIAESLAKYIRAYLTD